MRSPWPPILQQAIETVGWRQAHYGIAAFCVVTMLPLAFALRRKADLDRAHGPAGTRPMHVETPLSPRQLQSLLVIAGIACCIAMAMPQVHMVAYCGDLGYGAARGVTTKEAWPRTSETET